MSSPRQSANERRLAKLRVLKEEHFAEDLTDEELIEAKTARIELLEDEVAKLRKRVNQLEERERKSRSAQQRSPKQSQGRSEAESGPGVQPGLDFYRS